MKYKEFLSFVTVDAEEYSHMPQTLGLKPGKFPALAVYNPTLGQIFPYNQRREITRQAVEEFILDIVQGKEQPSVPGAGDGEIKHTEQ